jgi:hypothetical protein
VSTILPLPKAAQQNREPTKTINGLGIWSGGQSQCTARTYMLVRNVEDIDRYLEQVRKAATDTHAWIKAQTGDQLDLLRRMKFETIGFHPIEGHALNLVEQINQTWSYVVALAAARQLLELHPDVGGYQLAPGAHASIPLDIMSEVEGVVGAETFAAVDPRNNCKLDADLVKMAARPEQFRYVFFMSPRFPGSKRLVQFERDGVQVWSVDV